MSMAAHVAAPNASPEVVSEPGPVARWQHTAILIAVFALLTVAGAWFQSAAKHGAPRTTAPSASGALPIYLSLLAFEGVLVLYVVRGMRSTGTGIRDLIGEAAPGIGPLVRDLAIAAVLWGTWWLIDWGWDRVFGAGHAASIRGFLPRRPAEIVAWVALSCAAGFAEELVFRGYLTRQFAAWTRSPWLAVLLQAGLFGISHGYQGVTACLKIAVFGALFGIAARWRRGLRPGIIAHAATDILAGLFRI